MQFLINKYSLDYTCWALIVWEGICTVQQEHADNATSKRNIAKEILQRVLKSI
jgi:hypothetical protein